MVMENYEKEAFLAIQKAKEHGMEIGRLAATGMIQQVMIMIEHDRKLCHDNGLVVSKQIELFMEKQIKSI